MDRMKPVWEFPVRIVNVVDGDTVDVVADLGFEQYHGTPDEPVRMRLAGIDTPEPRSRDPREKKFGLLASARLRELLPVGSRPMMISKKLARKGRKIKRGRYGRALVDFRVDSCPSVCQRLLDESLAVPYRGESKAAVRPLHEANWDKLDKLEAAAKAGSEAAQ